MSIPLAHLEQHLQRLDRALEAGRPAVEAPGSLLRFMRQGYGLEEAAREGPALRRVVVRYRRLVAAFGRRFGAREVLLARAPGRVNLIGEHTDYNGLPVLPMAVDRDIAAVFSAAQEAGDAQVVLSNTAAAYPERRFELLHPVEPYPTGDWGNYAKAAAQGLLSHWGQPGHAGRGSSAKHPWRGLLAMLDGSLPAAAGMSSSSALVVLCARALLAANEREMEGLELAELLAEAEKYVGTQGGGMDQAISLLGEAGRALKIDFFPLRVRPAPLPSGYRFVVANSLVSAAKTAEALDKYNRRPIECRLAAALLRRAMSDHYGREIPLRLLGDLRPDHLALPEERIRELADSALHREPYALSEVARALGRGGEGLARSLCRRRDGSLFPEPPEGFKLWQRYRHVVDEGQRVEQAFAALDQAEVPRFGELMNASHESCRDLYEISCPELDRLVTLARGAGALGARLTGAGFGGCTVNLVPEAQVEEFIGTLRRSYYANVRGPLDPSQDIFACRASAAAAVLKELAP